MNLYTRLVPLIQSERLVSSKQSRADQRHSTPDERFRESMVFRRILCGKRGGVVWVRPSPNTDGRTRA